MKPLLVLIALGLWWPPALAADEARTHLLEGARAFRAEDYQQAQVEFRVALALGAGPQGRWYLAAALQKLGRTDEALDEFLRAEQEAPSGRDAVMTWYEAVASHAARLYVRADRLLASMERAGPRLLEQRDRLRAQLAPLLTAPVTPGALEWYLARAEAQRSPQVAALYRGEAQALASRGGPDAGTPKGSMPR